jgi:hypothetical protein
MQGPDIDRNFFSDDPHLRGGLLIWRLWIPTWVIVLCAVSSVLGLTAKPVYREYRFRRDLEAAQAAARHEAWSTARDTARSALLVRQHDLAASRILLRALDKLQDPRAYLVATDLFADSRASRKDRLEALQVMALQAPQALVFSAYASLSEAERMQASFRAAITPMLVQRGESEAAETRLREVLQATDEPRVRLELLRTLCSRPTPGRVAEARRIFAGLIASHASAETLSALLLLGDTPGGLAPGAPLPDLPAWLENQPQTTALHHLLGLHPALEASPESADHLYAVAIERFLPSAPGVLGTWLAGHDQADKAAWILKEPAKSHPDAYLARLQILLLLKQDAAIETALSTCPAGTDRVAVELVQASLAWLRDKPEAAETALARAMNHAAADTNSNRFIQIARFAELRGAKASAEQAWVGAIRLGWGPLPLYRDLLPVFSALEAKGRTEDLLASYRMLLRFEPSNPELLNHLRLEMDRSPDTLRQVSSTPQHADRHGPRFPAVSWPRSCASPRSAPGTARIPRPQMPGSQSPPRP